MLIPYSIEVLMNHLLIILKYKDLEYKISSGIGKENNQKYNKLDLDFECMNDEKYNRRKNSWIEYQYLKVLNFKESSCQNTV